MVVNEPRELVIRPAVATDLPQLVALLAGGALAPQPPEDPAALADALADIAVTAGTEILVAVLGGEVVGMCQLIVFRHLQHGGGRCAEIESMHVDAGHRGSGIGSALVGAAVDAARAAGCYRVQLTSNVARTDAHRFYERHGFVPSHLGFKLWL